MGNDELAGMGLLVRDRFDEQIYKLRILNNVSQEPTLGAESVSFEYSRL